jgi:hypothetical protein
MTMKLAIAAALAAGTLIAGSAVAQTGGGAGGAAGVGGTGGQGTAGAAAGTGAGHDTSGVQPQTQSNPYAGYKIDHGPGVIDHDTAAARARMYGTTPGAGPAVQAGIASYPAAYGPGYGPVYGGYAYEPNVAFGAGARCYQRRVHVNGRHWEWQRFCD